MLEMGSSRLVRLPAESSGDVRPSRLRKFYKDGLLDPVRLPASVLEEEKKKGQAYYSAQFMQDPAPPGGLMFQVEKIKVSPKVPEKWKMRVRSWDKAGTTSKKAAYTTGVLMGLDLDGRFWVLDVIRVRLDSFSREQLIERTAQSDGRWVVVLLEQEAGSGGKESAENTVRRLSQLREKPVVRVIKVGKSDGDKEDRADPYSSAVNGGNVCMVPAGWNREYLEELRYFPKSRYKDQVDASSLAYNNLYKPRRRAGCF
jgi:predicted phage terminase large subunit-like protein